MWHKYYRQILGTFTSNDVLIVKFEDLKDKTKRLSELNKVVQFLGYSKEELRFNCAFTLAEVCNALCLVINTIIAYLTDSYLTIEQ